LYHDARIHECQVFDIAAETVEEFIAIWEELFNSFLVEIRDVCFQPSCRNCFQFAFMIKFMAAKILLQLWKQMIFIRRRIPLIESQSVCVLQF
jgi:hypothetical protein